MRLNIFTVRIKGLFRDIVMKDKSNGHRRRVNWASIPLTIKNHTYRVMWFSSLQLKSRILRRAHSPLS